MARESEAAVEVVFAEPELERAEPELELTEPELELTEPELERAAIESLFGNRYLI